MPASRRATGFVNDEAVDFFGSPGSLLATVAVHNTSDGVRQLRRTTPGRERWALGAVDVYPAHFARRALLPPGATLNVPVRLAVSPDTPPGDHEVNVDIDGETRRAVLHVSEEVGLSVSPAEVVIGMSRQEQLRRVRVANTGNMDITVTSTAAPLDDELLTCRIMRAAIREFTEHDHGEGEVRPGSQVRFEGFLSELVRQADHVLQTAGLVRVRSMDGEVVVRPGQTAVINMAFSVPETLDRHTRYSAVVRIATADLIVRVVPSLRAADDATAEPAPNPGTESRRRSGRRQSRSST